MTLVSQEFVPIHISGTVRRGRLIIGLGKQEVALPSSRALAFLEVVARRLATEMGYTPHWVIDSDKRNVHSTISRLRKDIDSQLGPGTSGRIFEEVGRSMYRLIAPPECVYVEPTLVELVPCYMTNELAQRLLSRGDG